MRHARVRRLCTLAPLRAAPVKKPQRHTHLATAAADDGLGAHSPALLYKPLDLGYAALAVELHHAVLVAGSRQGGLPGGRQQPVGGLWGRRGKGGVVAAQREAAAAVAAAARPAV